MRKSSSMVILVTAIITVLALVLSGCATSSSPTTSAPAPVTTATSAPVATSPVSQEPIKIGLILPMSGTFAASLPFEQPGAQVAVDTINASGGVLGRKMQLVTLDDQGDPSLTAQKAAQLKAEGCVGIVGESLNANSLALGQWANDNHIPAYLHINASLSLLESNDTYGFLTMPNSWALAKSLTNAISQQADVKSVYTLAGEASNAHEVYGLMWPELNQVRPDIVNAGVTWTPTNQTDYTSDISAIISKKPDVLFLGLGGPPYISFIKQAQQFNLFGTMKVIGTYTEGPDSSTGFGKDFPQGIQTVTWWPFNLSEKPMQDFTKAFFNASGVYAGDNTSGYYTAILALAAAIQKAGSTDPDKIISASANLVFDSPVGNILIDDYTHQFHYPIWFATSGQSPDYPISVYTNLVEYQEGLYPTQAEIAALQATSTATATAK